MTDFEITKRCAEAMELPPAEERNGVIYCGGFDTRGFAGQRGRAGGLRYNPLHDDAQAMALVKKLGLSLSRSNRNNSWNVWLSTFKPKTQINQIDLNRAICECVAKMRQTHSSPS